MAILIHKKDLQFKIIKIGESTERIRGIILNILIIINQTREEPTLSLILYCRYSLVRTVAMLNAKLTLHLSIKCKPSRQRNCYLKNKLLSFQKNLDSIEFLSISLQRF